MELGLNCPRSDQMVQIRHRMSPWGNGHPEALPILYAREFKKVPKMRTHAQAVVIGGGVIGCSILYHLTKLGWSDVVLLERDELTSGSTWHAAANIHGLHDSTNISRIQHYTMNLYNELEVETGQSCGVFQPGSLYLAQTENREHQLRLQAAKAKFYGMNFHEVSREEAERLHPLVNYDGVRCIMFEPDGGNVDPSGVTHAYAAGARARGAEIHRFTPVMGTEAQADGSWIVRTPKGDIHTQWVVNAAGLWGREVAAMAGITLPLQPTEHQYFVTETIPEVAAMSQRLPSVADRDGEYYLRQEGQGLLIGAYEKDLRFWAEEGTPLDFAHELFADDLDRIEDNMMRAIDRVPAVGTAGIKRVINGPMIWSPDSNVLFGPHPDLTNYFCCNGIIPGFSQSGGMGLMSAQWMVEGESQYDMFAWDVARFGDWADKAFTKARVGDQYAKRFAIHFPNEERDAGRPVRTRPGPCFANDPWRRVWAELRLGACAVVCRSPRRKGHKWLHPAKLVRACGPRMPHAAQYGWDHRYFEFRQISRLWRAGGGVAQRRLRQYDAQGGGPLLPDAFDRCARGDCWRFHSDALGRR